jgi:hypothetical protein
MKMFSKAQVVMSVNLLIMALSLKVASASGALRSPYLKQQHTAEESAVIHMPIEDEAARILNRGDGRELSMLKDILDDETGEQHDSFGDFDEITQDRQQPRQLNGRAREHTKGTESIATEPLPAFNGTNETMTKPGASATGDLVLNNNTGEVFDIVKTDPTVSFLVSGKKISTWDCFKKTDLEFVRQVEIDWGHTSGDAEWACNNWSSDCGNSPGGCQASSTGTELSYPGNEFCKPLSSEEIKEILDGHNLHRANHGASPLQWSDSLFK